MWSKYYIVVFCLLFMSAASLAQVNIVLLPASKQAIKDSVNFSDYLFDKIYTKKIVAYYDSTLSKPIKAVDFANQMIDTIDVMDPTTEDQTKTKVIIKKRKLPMQLRVKYYSDIKKDTYAEVLDDIYSRDGLLIGNTTWFYLRRSDLNSCVKDFELKYHKMSR